MKSASEVSALVIDHGLFLPLARRLGETFKRVLYFTEWQKSFPVVNDCVIGDGFEEVERCDDFFPLVDAGEIDLVVCPDVMHSGLQLHFEHLGIPVWGSRKGDVLEMNREKFMRVLAENKLDVPPFERIVGTTKLAAELRNREDVYLKISKYRGSMETCHFRNWELDENLIHRLALRFGTCKDQIPFLVFDAIDTPLELGCDTYCVDGQWPNTTLLGYEAKDKGYFSAVTEAANLPDDITTMLVNFAPILAPYRYRNQWSMEIRKKGDKAYFIDATCRGGLPSTGSQIAAWKNFPEIIWHGANGELADPDPTCEFTAECILSMKRTPGEWAETEIPAKLHDAMKVSGCCCVDGVIGFPPTEEGNEIGWLVATGDTPLETIDELKSLAKQLPDGVTAHVDSLVDLLKEIHIAEKQGIEFSDQTVPKPEVVVAD